MLLEYDDTVPFDLSYFKGCLLDTDVKLDAVEVLSPKKITLNQSGDGKLVVSPEEIFNH